MLFHSYAGKQHKVSVEDAFMGYHSDAVAAIVMKVWTDDATEETKFNECKKALLWCCTPEIIVQIENSQLLAEKEFLVTNYFEHQQHTDIFAYLNINLTNRETPLFAQITTHSTLLTEDERRGFNHDICLLHLQSFDTEQQFCKELRSFSQKPEDKTRVLIIQSDSQCGNTSLVKSAQYCVDDNLPKDLVNFHVIFIIQLDRISQQQFSGYQVRTPEFLYKLTGDLIFTRAEINGANIIQSLQHCKHDLLFNLNQH
ncbi:hypothetical protein SNE40_019793 [Patella caerulea]|uniref:Uncharacterized protein n=1 Tax=Patella caerulea TaxID=87958 RepID=A0AAN8G665_PATCE